MDEKIWNDREVAFLRMNWMEKSASELGDILGRSKNSIIGKVRRLGLPRKKNPATRSAMKVNDSLVNGHIKGDGSIHFSDTKRDQCLYMSGTDGICCGKKVMEGKAYCEEHYKICYRGTSDVNTRGLDNETNNTKISMKPWR